MEFVKKGIITKRFKQILARLILKTIKLNADAIMRL